MTALEKNKFIMHVTFVSICLFCVDTHSYNLIGKYLLTSSWKKGAYDSQRATVVFFLIVIIINSCVLHLRMNFSVPIFLKSVNSVVSQLTKSPASLFPGSFIQVRSFLGSFSSTSHSLVGPFICLPMSRETLKNSPHFRTFGFRFIWNFVGNEAAAIQYLDSYGALINKRKHDTYLNFAALVLMVAWINTKPTVFHRKHILQLFT